MNFLEGAFMWPRLLMSDSGRSRLLSDIKNGEGYAEMGMPLHGLTAGYEMTKLGSPYRAKQVYERTQAGEDPFSRSFIGNVAQDQYDNIGGAFKENWPVLAAMGGGMLGSGSGGASGASYGGTAAGGGGLAAGDAAAMEAAAASAGMSGTSGASASSGMGMSAPAAGTDWLGMAQSGLGLLSGMGGGQQQPAAAQPPPQQNNNAEQQRRLQIQKRLQELRRKPRKTLAEQQEMQELMRTGVL